MAGSGGVKRAAKPAGAKKAAVKASSATRRIVRAAASGSYSGTVRDGSVTG